MGRPKKENAKKPGDLRDNEQLYTFIAERDIIDIVKNISKISKVSAKKIMNEAINRFLYEYYSLREEERVAFLKSETPRYLPDSYSPLESVGNTQAKLVKDQYEKQKRGRKAS